MFQDLLRVRPGGMVFDSRTLIGSFVFICGKKHFERVLLKLCLRHVTAILPKVCLVKLGTISL